MGATVQKNKDTTNANLVIQALPGADSVIATYDVGKTAGTQGPWNNQPRKVVHRW